MSSAGRSECFRAAPPSRRESSTPRPWGARRAGLARRIPQQGGQWRETGSSLQQSHGAARNEAGNVEQHLRHGKAAGAGDVLGRPHRLELLLESAQALEIVELIAAPV